MGYKMRYDKGATRRSGYIRSNTLAGIACAGKPRLSGIAGQSATSIASAGIIFRHDFVNGGYRAIQVNAPYLEGRGRNQSAALWILRQVVARWNREKPNENAAFDNLSPKA